MSRHRAAQGRREAAVKNLRRLIRLHRSTLDEKRAALGMLERKRADLLARIEMLERSHAAERELAERSLDAAVAYPAYAEGVRHRRKALELAIAELEREIVMARDAVLAAFAELKRFEVTLERKRELMRREASRLEQAKQNELGLAIYRRREGA